MFLSPQEVDKLTLVNVGFLAQRRLARGVKLNHPEAVALIATVVLELIRDGRHTVPQLMEMGRTLLGKNQVIPGVEVLVNEVQVEGTFPDGTKLVSVHEPIHQEEGDIRLALYGSCIMGPTSQYSTMTEGVVEPGEYKPLAADITLNADRKAVTLSVTNTADRPIQVGSHFHFIETNRPLKFDRAVAYGKRLDIPAGTAIRFEPGETKDVQLVDIAGNQIIRGGNRLAEGKVSNAGKAKALENVKAGGYLTVASTAGEAK